MDDSCSCMERREQHGTWLARVVTPPMEFSTRFFLIVDEAQSSYWDSSFWLILKDIKPETRFHVITFASYGSVGHNIGDPSTPILISSHQNISLIAVDHGDGTPIGLLLTRREFDELLTKVFVDHYFDTSFLDGVYNITNGHVGACEDFLRVVRADEVIRYPYTQVFKLTLHLHSHTDC